MASWNYLTAKITEYTKTRRDGDFDRQISQMDADGDWKILAAKRHKKRKRARPDPLLNAKARDGRQGAKL